MNWSVYMILSSDNTLYTGITTDIRRRWRQHRGELAGGAKYFRGRKPVSLAYLENGHDRPSASRREYSIRQLTRTGKMALINTLENEVRGYAPELPVLSSSI